MQTLVIENVSNDYIKIFKDLAKLAGAKIRKKPSEIKKALKEIENGKLYEYSDMKSLRADLKK